MTSDVARYDRGLRTALACWDAFARGRSGAAVTALDDVSVAAFPDLPEAAVYNNAVLHRGLVSAGPAIDAMESRYASLGITRFAAWVHESDSVLRAELERRGYRVDEWTQAMEADVDALGPIAATAPGLIAAAPIARHFGVLAQQGAPAGLNAAVDPAPFHALVGTVDGRDVATALAYDHDGDCGIYNVGTDATVRRRGFGTALVAQLLHDAGTRGCRTVSLQSSPMAVSLYAAVGFRDLGRILEYAPPAG